MNALRRQNIRPQQTFERWTTRTQESPGGLARQSEPKRKPAPQSEANMCRRRKCNLKKPPLLITQHTQYCTEHPTQSRGCVLVPRTQLNKLFSNLVRQKKFVNIFFLKNHILWPSERAKKKTHILSYESKFLRHMRNMHGQRRRIHHVS